MIALGTGRHPGSERSVGLPGGSKNCMCGAATCDLNHNHDEQRESERPTPSVDDIAEMKDGYVRWLSAYLYNFLHNQIILHEHIYTALSECLHLEGEQTCRRACHCITQLLRPFTPLPGATSLQSLLSWAILSSCCQLSPTCVMSATRSRRQVFWSPLFLLH